MSSEAAKLLRQARLRSGLSTTEVARLAGISQSAVSLLERDLRSPTLDTLVRLSDALGLDLPALIKAALKTAGKQD